MPIGSRALLHFTIGVSLITSASLAACGDASYVRNGSSGSSEPTSGSAGGDGADGVTTGGFSTASGTGGTNAQGFDVQPSAMQTLAVTIGQPMPTVAYTATFDGTPANAGWSLDRGDAGSVAPAQGSAATFTPSGTVGGPVKIVSGFDMQTLDRQIFIQLTGQQNGYDPTNPLQAGQVPADVAALTQGGGVGGVGGDGLGPGVTDAPTLLALGAPTSDGVAENLRFIYPYDGTVWPRGLLAPNLMWRWSTGDADAIRIDLSTTSGSFSWSGTFARPAILAQTGKPFVRHPIPQDVWKMATDTAGGADQLVVRLTVASGGVAYGPVEQTYTIAPARLSGTIYYNSYGTQLAKNFGGAVGGDHQLGGAVLSIRAGDPGPQLTAGSNGGSAQCRVCHSVAANGSRLIAQWGDVTTVSSGYDLAPSGATEFPLTNGAQFPGLSADGSMMLTPDANLYPLPDDTTALPATGLTDVSTSLGTPAFSPDTHKVSFNMLLSASITSPKQKLMVMDFDPTTFVFSNPLVVADYSAEQAEMRPGWPAFFPDGQKVVFHTQLAAGVDGNGLGDLRSRKGAKAEISWTSVTDASSVVALNQLNGKDDAGTSYLPDLDSPIALGCTGDGAQVGTIDADHGDDVHLNYEPTVNPVASGGYAWVVFTSRRLYGSVAEIPPFCSDPRGVDLIDNITPKKLWVAAVDVNGTIATDPSHPAFYLPGQELLAGNSRGFWALDPCKNDGNGCETGDECCNGFCQPDTSGELVCSNTPPDGGCSGPQEACTTAADCCDVTNLCINGFCTLQPPS